MFGGSKDDFAYGVAADAAGAAYFVGINRGRLAGPIALAQ
jgi:hypothetical protein